MRLAAAAWLGVEQLSPSSALRRVSSLRAPGLLGGLGLALVHAQWWGWKDAFDQDPNGPRETISQLVTP